MSGVPSSRRSPVSVMYPASVDFPPAIAPALPTAVAVAAASGSARWQSLRWADRKGTAISRGPCHHSLCRCCALVENSSNSPPDSRRRRCYLRLLRLRRLDQSVFQGRNPAHRKRSGMGHRGSPATVLQSGLPRSSNPPLDHCWSLAAAAHWACR